MTTGASAPAERSRESASGLAPWVRAGLPEPPSPRGLGWIGVVGPGVIVLGAAIGSGEFLLGPAVFVRHGLSLLWITGAAILFQTIFNTEVMRYTLATGEPVFTGFMRTRPSSSIWACVYTGLYLLQFGWPAFVGTAAGAVFFLAARRLPDAADADVIYGIGVGLFLTCVAILSVGRRIERTLEVLNWVLVACILTSFLVLAVAVVPGPVWVAGLAGYVGFDTTSGQFDLLPAGTDYFLLGALVAYSGAGGVANLTLSNWARDRGYGMAERAGYIPAAVGGQHVALAHSGFMFPDDQEGRRRWAGWWRVVRADQWGVFFCGAVLGMLLPALIYVSVLAPGTDIQGLGISAALAYRLRDTWGPLVGGAIAVLGAWTLFKTQLDTMDGMARATTDMLWTGSARVRAWRGGDVRAIYYGVLAVVVIWGVIALRLAQPILLLKLGANVGGLVFVIASVHLWYVNTRLLPPHVRPPRWRQAALLGMAAFYAVFVTRSLLAAFTV